MAKETSRQIRYALIGAGNIAQVAVLPAFAHAQNSKLVAIASSDPGKREALKARYGLAHASDYDHLEALLAEAEVDAVYIALPNHLHRAFTERAARAGVHVLCEKPMAASVEDCEAMIRACDEADVKLMIAYRLHFEAANLGAIELARSGKLGAPRILSALLTQQARGGDIRTRAEVGGGALLDAGVYCINAARYLFGEEPTEVFGYADVDPDPRFQGVDATTLALLRFPGGGLAQIGCSQAVAAVSSFRIVGEKGDLRVDPAFGYATERRHHLTVDGETRERTFAQQDQFAPELIYFSDCILEDREPEPSGIEGLADVRVIDAIARSVAAGRSVKLRRFEKSPRPSRAQLITRPAIEPPEPVNAPSPTQG